jgi:ABC-type Zn2+ transport system substrate-binding protein/surface adhesin
MIKAILTAAALSLATAAAAWALPVSQTATLRPLNFSDLIQVGDKNKNKNKNKNNHNRNHNNHHHNHNHGYYHGGPVLGSPLLCSSLQLASSWLRRCRSSLVLPVAHTA